MSMVEPPAGVEIAKPSDETAILELLRLKHREDGAGDFPNDFLRGMVRRGIGWNRGCIGVIRGKRRIEASIGLFLASWCWPVTHDYHLSDEWHFVHPQCRRGTSHGKRLTEFALWASNHLDRPLILVHIMNEQTAGKSIIFEKMFNGSFARLYLHDPARAADDIPTPHLHKSAQRNLNRLSNGQVDRLVRSGLLTGPSAVARLKRTG